MGDKRPAGEAMQYLRRIGVHALAQTGGENDDIHKKRREFSEIRDVSTTARTRGPGT
jgi:hypothetical protein